MSSDKRPSTSETGRVRSAWRDVDSERRRFGVTIWSTGGEVHLGRRLYRVRWSR